MIFADKKNNETKETPEILTEEQLEENLFVFLSEMVGKEAHAWWKKIGGGWFQDIGKSPELEGLKVRIDSLTTAAEKKELLTDIDFDIREAKAAITDLRTGESSQLLKSVLLGGILAPVTTPIAGGGSTSAAASVVGAMVLPIIGAGVGSYVGAKMRFTSLDKGIDAYTAELEDLKKKASAKNVKKAKK